MINKVILLGHVGKDPELRHLDNDRSVARFPLATSETYKNKSGEKITNTEWHNVIAWRGLAELAGKYIKKGSLIYIEGKIRSRSWDDKDGNKRYTTEIEADTIQLVGRRPEDAGGQGSANTYQSNENASSNIQNDQASGGETPGGFEYPQATNATDDLPF
jgi:single-strand DNA-binding protein